MVRIPPPYVFQPWVLSPLSERPFIYYLFDIYEPSLGDHIFEMRLYVYLLPKVLSGFDSETTLMVVCFVDIGGAVVRFKYGRDFGVLEVAARSEVAARKGGLADKGVNKGAIS
jgi:hypothetical protein